MICETCKQCDTGLDQHKQIVKCTHIAYMFPENGVISMMGKCVHNITDSGYSDLPFLNKTHEREMMLRPCAVLLCSYVLIQVTMRTIRSARISGSRDAYTTVFNCEYADQKFPDVTKNLQLQSN